MAGRRGRWAVYQMYVDGFPEAFGTIDELAARAGVRPQTMEFYARPAARRRCCRTILVRIA